MLPVLWDNFYAVEIDGGSCGIRTFSGKREPNDDIDELIVILADHLDGQRYEFPGVS